jgi:hypothetical protein
LKTSLGRSTESADRTMNVMVKPTRCSM